ncbi:chloride channel protein [Marinobacterium sediminicola]|uniref:Chloride channel protein, CIC family n=1 Tax=Marinobacterium sediminicola TaxID=518898 RepID=A0ABY1S4D5_9GAMM|nr:chloride channel protein [Marinobacterium sediminicola]ULG68884.1 chloride channel protein [Marinobacterium sediminicola]SMR77914.1 chloride channel protein, CIC family [Marinobacterium sediminicola]
MPHRPLSLEHFRQRLAHADALPQLVILGILAGLAAGGLISLFRSADTLLQAWLLPGGAERFEELDDIHRLLLPLGGSLLLILLFAVVPAHARAVGIVHMLERLTNYEGRLPIFNLFIQGLAALIALASGHSVGREGPAVHLGAGAGSLLGQRLYLPNNSMRVLVGCGAAAGIAATFNTPLAAVIFSMEVVLLEYTLIGFLPVMVAALVGDIVSRALVGEALVFTAPNLSIEELTQLPLIAVLGLVCGLLATGFHLLQMQVLKLKHWPFPVRFLLAGLLTGIVALQWPEVMGGGYDTIESLFTEPEPILFLAGLLLAKCLLTPIVIGLGIPAGLIGPTLFIGVVAGALLGAIGSLITDTPHTGLYAMLGMGAMMAALLNAPLAALLAMLELTQNTSIILPGMLAILVANLTTRFGFGLPSIFHASLQHQGLDLRQAPLAQILSRAAVGSLMQRDFSPTPSQLSLSEARLLLEAAPHWLLVNTDSRPVLMPPADLRQHLEGLPEDADDSTPIDLLSLPAQRSDIEPLLYRATLKEALDQMQQKQLNYLLVVSNRDEPLGLISRQQIEEYYNRKQTLS